MVGWKICSRPRQQWETFEKDVDCVVPLTIRRKIEEEIEEEVNSREWVLFKRFTGGTTARSRYPKASQLDKNIS